MALVVLLRGVNVGGHRTFRPSAFAARLKHLGAVSIGAAGTFVIRRPVSRATLRAELARGLPFEAQVVICEGREIIRLMADVGLRHGRVPRGAVRFVSVLSRRPRTAPPMPMHLPSTGRWLVKFVARDGRYVLGLYRRDMRVIGYLGALDRIFGAPSTTRNWNTIAAVCKVLAARGDRNETT